ncbi:thymidylate synthase [bacterium]|nr:thymidylate synthase [bacterium]
MEYRPYDERVPDEQYKRSLGYILDHGELAQETAQGVGAITYIAPPPMHFDLSNGIPLITERKIGFWKKPIAEILAFVKGKRTLTELEEEGCNFWTPWATRAKCESMGLESGDLGPGSYGAAFHDFPKQDGATFNQFQHLVTQIKEYPWARTHFVTPWIPYLIGRGGHQKAVVSPCHGWIHCRVIDKKLTLHVYQRSADFPVGVPSNMIQYAALTLMIAQVTGLKAHRFVHSFSDAHIYTSTNPEEDQVPAVREMLQRAAKRLPTLIVDPNVTDLFEFKEDDFSIMDYEPHPSMQIPVAV